MNFFTLRTAPEPGTEQFDTLFENPAVTIERIASNRLVEGEWYDQERDEWVMLARGNARLEFDEEVRRDLQPGDCLFIEAHVRHRVLETSEDALWLAVHIKREA